MELELSVRNGSVEAPIALVGTRLESCIPALYASTSRHSHTLDHSRKDGYAEPDPPPRSDPFSVWSSATRSSGIYAQSDRVANIWRSASKHENDCDRNGSRLGDRTLAWSGPDSLPGAAIPPSHRRPHPRHRQAPRLEHALRRGGTSAVGAAEPTTSFASAAGSPLTRGRFGAGRRALPGRSETLTCLIVGSGSVATTLADARLSAAVPQTAPAAKRRPWPGERPRKGTERERPRGRGTLRIGLG